jgi:outer membrane protein assembly factor BamB
MAHFFALLLALVQAQAPAGPPPISFDARWVTTFDTPAAATPGFDDTAAFVPLKASDEEAGVAAKRAQLVAVDLGTIRWQLDVATTFTPATGEGLVFTVSEEMIEARDAKTGATKWRAPLPGGAAAPLYWDTGWLIASTTAGDLAAFRAADGTLVWRRQLGAPLNGPPAPALDRLFLPLADNRLVSVMLADGATLWERPLTAPITGLLALEDQLVFGTASKELTSVDLRRGRDRWTRRLGGDLAGIPSADEKRIFFASRDNLLMAVDRKSGNLRWKADLASRPAGGPLTLPVALVMPLVSSQIIGFDPETGKPTITATAASEIGLQPYVRRGVRQTQPQLITVSREGQLQGFGRRFEPVPQRLTELVGLPATP